MQEEIFTPVEIFVPLGIGSLVVLVALVGPIIVCSRCLHRVNAKVLTFNFASIKI